MPFVKLTRFGRAIHVNSDHIIMVEDVEERNREDERSLTMVTLSGVGDDYRFIDVEEPVDIIVNRIRRFK